MNVSGHFTSCFNHSDYGTHRMLKIVPKTTNQLIFKIRVRFNSPQGNETKSERNELFFMNSLQCQTAIMKYH